MEETVLNLNLLILKHSARISAECFFIFYTRDFENSNKIPMLSTTFSLKSSINDKPKLLSDILIEIPPISLGFYLLSNVDIVRLFRNVYRLCSSFSYNITLGDRLKNFLTN